MTHGVGGSRRSASPVVRHHRFAWFWSTLGIVAALSAFGCAIPSTPNQRLVRANTILTRVGIFAEDTFYACLLNGYMQGLPMKTIQDQCATKLEKVGEQGFGGPFGDIGPANEKFFDPAKVTASCNTGDTRRGQGRSSGKEDYSSGGINYGEFTWGRNVRTEDHRGVGVGAGKTYEESLAAKEAAVKEFDKKLAEFRAAYEKYNKAKGAREEAEKTGDPDKIKAAKEAEAKAKQELDQKTEEASKAQEKAEEDPNNGGITRGTAEPSECESALQAAREILWECNRTGWKSIECRQLQAKISRGQCQDPALIYVDPEQGYSCNLKIDGEAVKNAWVARCEERKRFGPDANPCVPPTVDRNGHYLHDSQPTGCTPAPDTYIEPGSDMCVVAIEVKQFGEPDAHKLLVWGLNRLGGPVVVLPAKDPTPPRPGPEPRPGPTN
jgi:hypothetical protein